MAEKEVARGRKFEVAVPGGEWEEDGEGAFVRAFAAACRPLFQSETLCPFVLYHPKLLMIVKANLGTYFPKLFGTFRKELGLVERIG